ncbi:importin-4-like [Daphnia carinata]|uniref:importin-4-like n=1 Tax=Daphnia carinata TaxID=120202 RepID=UPI002579F488|nr:importin-4-like [Daphnia carinata]
MSSVDEILAKVLEPDNESIKTGTAELKEALKRPTICPTLLHIGKYSPSPQIRQYALVLLRKRLAKYYHWEKLTLDFKHSIKSGLLDALTREPETSVRNAAAQVIASIAQHELADRKWPELLTFIQQLCCQGKPNEKELGLYLLSIVADSAGEELKVFLKPFISIFHSALQDSNVGYAYYAGMTLKNLIPYIGTEEATMIQPLIPKVLVVVKNLVHNDGAKAVNLMEIWEELLETEVSLLAPHLKAVAELCLEIASKKDLDDSIRIRALNFIATLARLKKKSMIKNKLVSPILQTLFVLMAEADEEEEDDDEDDQVESSKPCIVAAQTLNEMALHLPPDKVITPLLQWAEPAFKGSDIRSHQAAYTALAVVAEGCAEHIRTKYLPAFVQCVCNGIKHPQAYVRNAALYAVGQFSEHLQPDIDKYANDILPVLFEYLSATCNSLASGQKVPRCIDRVFYALETFCETMEEKLIPFVPSLMDHFFAALNPAYPFHVKELALSAVGATANAVGKAMVPYFGRVMEYLKVYLSGQLTPEEMPLQVQALDTLGVIARTIGEQTFRPFAEECLHFTLTLVQGKDDPDLRKCAYGVFASLSCVLKDDMAAALPVIVPLLMKAVESNEGVTAQLKDDDDESAFPAGDLLDDDEDVSPMDNEEDDDESDVAGYTVENAYLEEKEEACLALRELALQARGPFISYVEQCSGPIYKLVDYGHEDIRRAALSSLTQFTICIGKQPNGEEACLAALAVLIPKLSEAIHTDSEIDVVNGALDCLTELLKELKGLVIKSQGHLDAVLMCIKNVFSKSTQCQMMEQAEESNEEEDDPEDPDSEASEKLIEYAGDVLPALGSAMTPQEFAPYFAGLLPSILQRTKKNCTIAEKSFSAGVLAVCMEPLDGVLEPFVPHLYTAFTTLMRDSDSEVRNNSVFGLGELVLHGRELLFPNYPQILQFLSTAVSREDNPLALDNICAAITRLIIVNMSAVPMDQVFPVLMSHLPLREDFHENSSVLKCFLFLFQNGHPLFVSHLPQIMNVILTMATQQELQPEQKPMINELMGNIASGFSDLYNGWAAALPAEVQLKLKEVLA